MYDDILIHGRTIAGLLSTAEEVFANRYLELRRKNPEKGKDYSASELYDIFLSFIHILFN